MTVARLIELIPGKSAEERRQMRENAKRSLAARGQRASDATALLEALDTFEAQTRERRMRAPTDADKIVVVVEAFRQLPLSETDRMLVQVLLNNLDASSEQLTEAMGWKDQAWQLHFGKMCERREHLLWPAPFEPKRNAPFYSGILADFDEDTRGFTLKPEVVEAFARLGLRAQGSP
jgi:hypothetical protein